MSLDPDATQTPDAAHPPLTVRSTKVDTERHPDLHTVNSAMLMDGPRARKEATYLVVCDRHTGEVHHDSVTIKTYRKKAGTWGLDLEHSITLSSEKSDELATLVEFIRTARSKAVPAKSGTFVVLEASGNVASNAGLQNVLNTLSVAGKGNVLAEVLSQSSSNPQLLTVLLDRAQKDPLLFAEAAAALNLATYRRALDDLTRLVNTSEKEGEFQKLLGQNPWMFGSEYSQVLDRRKWTRDENQDFVLRRTADGYIELIEIKTPLNGTKLFNYDGSHDSYYASNPLSVVVGQVQHYIEKLDCERNSIKANDGEDTCKIRAKIIIGRDGDDKQKQALRRFNGHLHRIEVLTFDQLTRIAGNVLGYLDSALRPSPRLEHAATPPTAAQARPQP